MEFVTLNNGLKMPSVGFGVFQIPEGEECTRAVLDAINVGYRLIDTAQSYGNEKSVGAAINESSVPREELFITTKVWISNAGYEKGKASIEESLKKMKLEYLDLVLIHQPLNDYYGTYRAMEELYKKGRIRAIGTSNFYPDRLVDITLFNEVIPQVNQVEVNPFNQQLEAETVHEKYGIQMEAWAPFVEGKNEIFTNPVLKKIGNKYDKSNAQIILRWLLQRGIVPLAKSVKKERMEENINIFDFQLTDDDMNKISELDNKKSSFFDHREASSIERLASLIR
ncbi:aldo/keto reductase [Alloiococcus sp. CFN-8]|uniref:aldo/keto reductase n=1 Tax=Alloiococcus sp. CFN-8 TaxID=3416081 RepID=UPI003CF17D54